MKKVFLLSVLTLFLAACGGAKGNSKSSSTPSSSSSSSSVAHTHTFSNEWESDETDHWHPATCDHDVVSDKAAHTVGENNFCSVCGRFLGKTFSLVDQEGYADFIHEEMDMEENEIYYCRISGGHSGHAFDLEDGDPQPSLADALTAYVFVGGAKVTLTLDDHTPQQLGDDGYLYISIDASLLTNREDVWFRICEDHVTPSAPTPGTLAYLGFCPVDNHYTGYTHTLNASLSPTIQQGKYVYRRVATTTDTEYGLWAMFNDHIENTSKVEAFAIVNNEPVLLETAYDYDYLLLHFPENASDNHIYLVF